MDDSPSNKPEREKQLAETIIYLCSAPLGIAFSFSLR